MGLIPEEIITQVLDRCDIVEVVSSYIPLKRAGRNFKACCPFHHEKTPSFVVNPDKQIYHCFGCGVGGNVISFVMQQEHVEFPEAMRMMAVKVGIVIPETSADEETLSLKEILYKANDLSAQFFHDTLVTSSEVGHIIKYLKDRGINLDTVKKFKLGFAQEKWDSLLTHLKGKNVALSAMEKAGLIVPKENRDGYYDRFRDRIIFPIFDIKARCIAFGARATKETATAKYINSPETPLYTKGNHLYGFHITKDAVRAKDFVIVVEGYVDFIIPFQAGVDNIVASSGTALTTEQIRLLRRYTQNIVMLFDADAAGENAMVRSLDLLIEEGMNVKVATLAAGEDPDSFVRKFGVEQFNERITQALSLFDYKVKILMSRHSHKTPEGKAKISGEMLTTINRFQNAVVKFSYVKQLAHVLAVPEEALQIELQKIAGGTSQRKIELPQSQPVAPQVARNVERNLLKLMLEDEKFIGLIKEEVDPSDFQDERIRLVINQLFDWASQGKDLKAANVMSLFQDEGILQMISQLMTADDLIMVDKEKIYRDCVNRMKHEQVRSVRKDLLLQIRQAEVSGDQNRLDELKTKFNQLIKG